MIPFREKGVPAVLQIEDMERDFNKHYHRSEDTVDHMDLPYFVAQVRALVAVVERLVGPGPATATPLPTPGATDRPLPTPNATATPAATALPGASPLYAPFAATGRG